MPSTTARIPSSEKTSLYLTAARDHLGLIVTFLLTLTIPVAGIAIGVAGNEIMAIPIFAGTLFFIIPYFILSTLKSSIGYGYEVALINRFGVDAVAIVTHKFIEDDSYYAAKKKSTEITCHQKVDDISYFIEYQYTYGKPYKSSCSICSKALYDKIDIGSEVPIKVLPSSPDKSAPRREELAQLYITL